MFVPIHDSNPLRIIRFQGVTGTIVLVNFAVFLYTHYIDHGSRELILATSFGLIPALLTDNAVLDQALYMVPEPLTLVTYMFLHGGWLHIISNMLFLWVFADNIEDAFGHFGFFLFYIFAGIVAALAHAFFFPLSHAPLVGASGAVSAVLAAYLVLFPRTRIWVLLFFKLPLRLSAMWALLGWLGAQLLSLYLDQGSSEVQVAIWAHIGGFISGLIITLALRSRLLTRLGYLHE